MFIWLFSSGRNQPILIFEMNNSEEIYSKIVGSLQKHMLVILTMPLLLAGCGGYSVREHAIRSNLPQDLRTYNNGIIANPTDTDIQAAIALGATSKDDQTLEYAYLTKAPRGLFANDSIYIRVATPLYLIADHSREQTRDFRKVDDDFVQYARTLGAVRISISQQYMSTVTWNAYEFQRQVVLLRDGIRVEPMPEISGWEGQNPFADKPSKEMQAALSQVSQTMTQYSRSYAANMTQEQKVQLLKTYQTMGLSEDQMAAYTGFDHDEIHQILGEQVNTSNGNIVLSEFDAIFPVDELRKPGNYELVFRTPPTASLIASGDKEIRFPISLAGFR